MVHLQTHQAFGDKSGYQIVNPVEAGAVSHSRQWPGAIVHADEAVNKRITVRRPDAYFDPKNKSWPASVTLDLTMREFGDCTDEEVRELIAQEAERLEDEARRRVVVLTFGDVRKRNFSEEQSIGIVRDAAVTAVA